VGSIPHLGRFLLSAWGYGGWGDLFLGGKVGAADDSQKRLIRIGGGCSFSDIWSDF
jgi:hypothetical protein